MHHTFGYCTPFSHPHVLTLVWQSPAAHRALEAIVHRQLSLEAEAQEHREWFDGIDAGEQGQRVDEKARKKLLRALKVVVDCPTRWSSTFYMLQRLLLLQRFIMSYFDTLRPCKKSTRIRALLQLSYDEWSALTEVTEVLKPFADATEVFSSESEPTGALVWPIFAALSGHTIDLFHEQPLPPQEEQLGIQYTLDSSFPY